jgi:hypothetical protein
MPSGAKGKNAFQAGSIHAASIGGSAATSAGPAGPSHILHGPLEDGTLAQTGNTVGEPMQSMHDSDQEYVVVGEGSSTMVGGSGWSQARNAGEEINNNEEKSEDGHDAVPPTSPPPSPSLASKRRFSAIDLESVSVSAGNTPTSRSLNTDSSISKRGRTTGPGALASIGRGLADFNSIFRSSLDQREARHRQ